MQERRAAQRFRTDLNVRWETLKSQGRGAVCDLSSSGCFVLTGGEVIPGELVRLELILANEVAALWGQIVYSISEMGFAVRFAFGNEADERLMHRLIETSRQL